MAGHCIELGCVEDALGRIAQHVALQPLLVAEERPRHHPIEPLGADQLDRRRDGVDRLCIGDPLFGIARLTEHALEVLHPETARAGLVRARDHHVQALALLRRQLAEQLARALVQGGELLAGRVVDERQDARADLLGEAFEPIRGERKTMRAQLVDEPTRALEHLAAIVLRREIGHIVGEPGERGEHEGLDARERLPGLGLASIVGYLRASDDCEQRDRKVGDGLHGMEDPRRERDHPWRPGACARHPRGHQGELVAEQHQHRALELGVVARAPVVAVEGIVERVERTADVWESGSGVVTAGHRDRSMHPSGRARTRERQGRQCHPPMSPDRDVAHVFRATSPKRTSAFGHSNRVTTRRCSAICYCRSATMRYLVVILGLAAVIGGLVYVKFAQISSLIGMGEAMKAAGPPPEAVSTAIAGEQRWESTVPTVGTVASSKGVAISTEVAGVVSAIEFTSGASVERGAVLMQLDARVEKAQLASAQVKRSLALTTAKRARSLIASGAESAAQLDADENAYQSASADVDVLRAQIARKTIRAPFTGRLGIREVDIGQYLNPGTTVTTLESVEGVYVDFDLPQQQEVTRGQKVRVTVTGRPDFVGDGEIVAIDPKVDSSTRMTKLRATMTNADDDFHPGMFVRVEVIQPEQVSVVAIPATAILYATYGDSVFIVEPPAELTEATGPDGQPVVNARQQFVRLGARRGDFVAVLEGVTAGAEVVTEGAFKLRNNAPIYVDNERPLTASLTPTPANR
jgi:membrane fusion protein, multidrug efflux system